VTASFCELLPCKKWNVQYTPVFGLVQPLPGDFRSNDVTSGSLPVTWGHVTSVPVTWLPPPASYSLVGSEMYSIRQFSAFYSPFQVTYAQMTSLPDHFWSPGTRDVISFHVTASSCEVELCRKWNVQYTPVFGLLQPLPGDFRSNDVTSGSLLVTWGYVTSFPVMWLPPPANYSLVGSEMHSIRQFSAFYSHFQVTSGQMTSLPDRVRSPEVTWHHFLSRDCLLLQATALQEVKCTVYASFRPSIATSRWLPIKWRHLRVTSGHLRSREVISCHVTASSCKLQPCRNSNVQHTPVFGLLQPLPGDFRSPF